MPPSRRRRRAPTPKNIELFMWDLAISVVAVLFFEVILMNPNPQGTWLREGGVIETAQALMFLGAGFGFIQAARVSDILKQGGWWRYVPIAAWILLMFVFFGEEISWGQRLIGFPTPETGVMGTNIQNEVNIHNLPGVHGIKSKLVNYFLLIVGIGLPLITLFPPIRWLIRFFAIPVSPIAYIPIFVGAYLLHSYQLYPRAEFGYTSREYSETLIALAMVLFAWHGASYPDSLFRGLAKEQDTESEPARRISVTSEL